MQVKKFGKRYEKPEFSVNMFTDEDVLTVSGDGEVMDGYDDGWKNPFIGVGGTI